MKDPRREYEAALADFSQPGGRWNAKGRLTYWGKAAGLTADEIVSDARAAGVTDRDADIRRGWNDAKPKGDRPHGDWRRYVTRAKPKPPQTFPRYVRDMVAAGGEEATSADLLALSPLRVPMDGNRTQTDAFLRSLFAPADQLHIFRDDTPTIGRPGVNLMPCRDWLARIDQGDAIGGDLIVPNPFTGAEDVTTEGKKSYIAQSCLARFPFIVIEFDDIKYAFGGDIAKGLRWQCAFWRGLLATSPLAPKVASIVYSGGKSLHGLLHVGCRTLADWQNVRDQLRRLLAADPYHCTDADGRVKYPYRADEQAMHPRTGTRLPGVRRFDNGRSQRLLYLNPGAVRPTQTKPDPPTAHAEPRGTPQTRPMIETGKETAKGERRATGQIFALPCDCAPMPPREPPDDAPLDGILAYFDVLESMA